MPGRRFDNLKACRAADSERRGVAAVELAARRPVDTPIIVRADEHAL